MRHISPVKFLSDNTVSTLHLYLSSFNQNKKDKMATSKMRERLVTYQIKWIASEVSLQNMKDVALKYMDFSEKEINAVFRACLPDYDTMNSELLKYWAEKNSEVKQVHVSPFLIFRLSCLSFAVFQKQRLLFPCVYI